MKKPGLTVGELIKQLEQYDPYLDVYLAMEYTKYSVTCTGVEDDDIGVDGCITLVSNGSTHEFDKLDKKQQLSNEMLLATYSLLEEFMERERCIVGLHDTDLHDYFYKAVKKDADKKMRQYINANIPSYTNVPPCTECGSRFMEPVSIVHDEITYWCRICDNEVTIKGEDKYGGDGEDENV